MIGFIKRKTEAFIRKIILKVDNEISAANTEEHLAFVEQVVNKRLDERRAEGRQYIKEFVEAEVHKQIHEELNDLPSLVRVTILRVIYDLFTDHEKFNTEPPTPHKKGKVKHGT